MRLVVVFGCVGFGGVLGAQSFDCKLAKSVVEKAVCGSKELSAADGAMAAKYTQVLAAVPEDVQAEVKSDQRAWLRGVTQHCGKAAESNMVPCLQNEYATQRRALDARVVTKGGVTFMTRSIELLAKDDADDPWLKEPDLEQTPGYGTLDASWPQALSGDPMWVAWNAAVLAETQKMAGGEAGMKGWDKSLAAGTDATVTATVERVSAQLVSISIEEGGMGHGAAHPNEASEEFHWLLKEQRALKVGDVFAEGSAWEKVVGARCRASLKEQVGDDYQSYAGSTAAEFAKTLHGVVADPRNWDIDAKGITINFPEYSVTPRSEPVEGVTVPWSALRAFLATGFVVPR
jgi:uncharacterized protein YecT (DUF1311 family)